MLHDKIPVIMGLLPWEAMKSGYVPPATHSGSQQCTHTHTFLSVYFFFDALNV